MMFKMLDGNAAAVEAMKLARVKVIAAYPITPQSSISEKLSEIVASGEMDAQYIRVESEHTAMSACIGAALAGCRAGTATSSNGLALMSEMITAAAGIRTPIVMPVVNRAIAAPWSLWCEHMDTMSQRDLGWMQFFTQNCQDVLDYTLAAYKIAENKDILIPAMVCLDGFFLSHSMQKIDVPQQSEVDGFIGEYKTTNTYLDPDDPMFVSNVLSLADYTEVKYQQKAAMDKAFEVIEEVFYEFEKKFGRKLNIIEEYKTQDADAVLVCMGSMTGTVKYVVDEMRKKGKKVGMIKLVLFRPFPNKYIYEALKGKKVVGVFDRNSCLGGEYPPVCTEVIAALKGCETDIRDYVGGLGGRDVSPMNIEKIFDELTDIYHGRRDAHTKWIDLKENPMDSREVFKYV
jgi:pyruvate ferredoxin oxidoreductase alpha subunit